MAWFEIKKSGQHHVAFHLGNQKFKRFPGTAKMSDCGSPSKRIQHKTKAFSMNTNYKPHPQPSQEHLPANL